MKTVAIIGASNDRAKFGNKAVRAFQQQGYQVFPVNPKEDEIEGLPAFKSIRDVPVRPAMISVYLPPPVVLKSCRTSPRAVATSSGSIRALNPMKSSLKPNASA